VEPLRVVVEDEYVERVMLTLKSKIQKMVESNELTEDSPLTYPGLALLTSPHHWKPHFADIKMYLESCVALNRRSYSIGNLRGYFLTTDDHDFFQFLVQSPTMSDLFRECVVEVGVVNNVGACIPLEEAREVI
jgi:hypothetical protein